MNEQPPTTATPSTPGTSPGTSPGKPNRRAPRERLDVALVARGLAPSRERARALIMAGMARVDGQRATKPGTLVAADARVTLAGESAELRYASRGGLKLEHALDAFALNPAGLVCLDVGASTGGFTDVVLRRGAARVYAVDVGRGQLAWALRQDPRVVVMERTNIRHLAALPEPVACAVIDVSFISLRLVLPAVTALVTPGAPGGWIAALVKPQFEAGRREADRGAGVISDPEVHRRVLRELLGWARAWNAWDGTDRRRLAVRGLTGSPIAGRDGNREYLLRLDILAAPEGTGTVDAGRAAEGEPASATAVEAEIDAEIDAVVTAAFARRDLGSEPEREPERDLGRDLGRAPENGEAQG